MSLSPPEPSAPTEGQHLTDYIVIERGLDANGQFVQSRTSNGLHIVEALGMLEFAKMRIIEAYDTDD